MLLAVNETELKEYIKVNVKTRSHYYSYMVVLFPQINYSISNTFYLKIISQNSENRVELTVFGVIVICVLLRFVIGEASLFVSHCNHGNVTPSVKTGRDLGTGRLLNVSGFISPPMDELASLLSPSTDEISVSSTFEIKSSIYFSASSVKRIDIRLLSLLLWTIK